ncbi:MAG: TetR family transcriptional regulator [Acidobacteria bacterium]|nr:TetR family transcriptional regulator [Acidobacteriota bacterium]
MNVHSLSSADVRMPATAPARRAPRTQHTGDKHDLIIKAATKLFARRGFFNAQVADVAREAGIAAGTVYLYFESKDDLLISIFERTMHEGLEAGRQALAGVSDPVERLRRLAQVHLQRLGQDRDLAVVFQVELRQTTKFMERFSSTLLKDYLHAIRDAIADAQTAGVFRRDVSPTFAAKMLYGGLDEMATNWILSRRRYALAAQADEVVDLFVNGMKT